MFLIFELIIFLILIIFLLITKRLSVKNLLLLILIMITVHLLFSKLIKNTEISENYEFSIDLIGAKGISNTIYVYKNQAIIDHYKNSSTYNFDSSVSIDDIVNYIKNNGQTNIDPYDGSGIWYKITFNDDTTVIIDFNDEYINNFLSNNLHLSIHDMFWNV